MIITGGHYRDVMTSGPHRRPIFVELFGPLVGLDDEWRAQGATEQEISLEAFGFDVIKRHHIMVSTGLLGGTDMVIEETPEHIVSLDRYGRKTRLIKRSATIPHPLEYPVKDIDSWLKIKSKVCFLRVSLC